MSWKTDILETYNAVISTPFLMGGLVTIATSLISSYRKHPQMERLARWTEALACALISTAITNAGILYLGFDESWGISIGVFVGWIGTNELKILLQKAARKFIFKEDSPAAAPAEKESKEED